MPVTKLDNKNTVADLVKSVKKLEQTGPRVKIPGTNLEVDLLTGTVFLSEEILGSLRKLYKYSVDKESQD